MVQPYPSAAAMSQSVVFAGSEGMPPSCPRNARLRSVQTSGPFRSPASTATAVQGPAFTTSTPTSMVPPMCVCDGAVMLIWRSAHCPRVLTKVAVSLAVSGSVDVEVIATVVSASSVPGVLAGQTLARPESGSAGSVGFGIGSCTSMSISFESVKRISPRTLFVPRTRQGRPSGFVALTVPCGTQPEIVLGTSCEGRVKSVSATPSAWLGPGC